MTAAESEEVPESVKVSRDDDLVRATNKILGDVYGLVLQAGHIDNVQLHLPIAQLQMLTDAMDKRSQAPVTPDVFERKSLPRTLSWTQRSRCVGRSRELADLRERVSAGRHVLIYGPAGIGKTSLLQQAFAEGVVSADTVPGCDGVLRPSAWCVDTDDVLRDLVSQCYDVKTSVAIPAKHLLSTICALVVLDDLDWSPAQVREVLDAMPSSVFVVTSRHLDSSFLLKPLPLAGLSLADSIELLEDELGEPLSGDERLRAERVRDRCDGNPKEIVWFARAISEAAMYGSRPKDWDNDEKEVIIPRQVAWAGKQAEAVLRTLLVFRDVFWGKELLRTVCDRELSGVDKLEHAELVTYQRKQRRYRVNDNVADVVSPLAGDEARELIDRIIMWVGTEASPGLVAAELGVLERAVRRMLNEQLPLVALVLARMVSVKLLPSLWWDRGDRVLKLGLRAAREEGSRTDEMYFAYALASRRAADHKTEEALELLIALVSSSRDGDDQQIVNRANEMRSELAGKAGPSDPTRLSQNLTEPPGPVGRSLEAMSQLVLRIPVLNTVVGAMSKLASDHPTELRSAVAGIMIVAGVLFGLPSSAPPTSAGGAPEIAAGLAAPTDTPDRPIAPSPAGDPPAPGAPNPAMPVSPSPVPVTSTPPAGKTSSASPGSTPGTSTVATGGRPTDTDYRYNAAPDLSGTWQLDFTRTNFGGIWMGVPDRYTITLHRLEADKCGHKLPCYGGRWIHGDHTEGTNFVAAGSPAPTGLSATDSDADGNQEYNGTVIANDTRQPLSYQGDWTGDGGRTATFRFTRLS